MEEICKHVWRINVESVYSTEEKDIDIAAAYCVRCKKRLNQDAITAMLNSIQQFSDHIKEILP